MELRDTLEKVFTDYESMIKSADRAEEAAAQMDEYKQSIRQMLGEAEARP